MPRKRSRGPKEEELNTWGEWVDTFAAILHTNYKEIAAYTNPRMDPSTLSRLARKPEGPTPESVPRVWDALYQIAQERDQHMDGRKRHYTDLMTPTLRNNFYNAGGTITDQQRETAVSVLRALQVYLDILRDSEEKEQIIELLEEQIKQLSQEIKELRP